MSEAFARLPADIERFVRLKFDPDDIAEVERMLDRPELSTARVVRSVLYLCNGSIGLLRYYVQRLGDDLPGILLAAEYETSVAESPMLARDMALPFDHRRNLGREVFRAKAGHPKSVVRGSIEGRYRHSTGCLDGQRFYLGEVAYVVARGQGGHDPVRCYRIAGTEIEPVRLPLIFVLERLAEPVSMEGTYL